MHTAIIKPLAANVVFSDRGELNCNLLAVKNLQKTSLAGKSTLYWLAELSSLSGPSMQALRNTCFVFRLSRSLALFLALSGTPLLGLNRIAFC